MVQGVLSPPPILVVRPLSKKPPFFNKGNIDEKNMNHEGLGGGVPIP